jgi:Spy/CpxP family protein refolding chaperone
VCLPSEHSREPTETMKTKGESTMKTKRTATAVAIVLLFAILFTAVYAKEVKNPRIIPAIMHILAPPTEEENRVLAEKLEMTPEQKKKMNDLYENYRQNTRSFRNQYEVKFNQLLKLMEDPAPKPKQVQKECREFLDLEQKVLNAELNYWMGLKKVLTKRQNNQLWNFVKDRRLK